MPAPNDAYRDRLFTFLFGSEKHRDWTLDLYNAINGTDYSDPEAIAIKTIREVLYLGMHNDASFLLADEMSLYKQQSSFNPNMPLRMLQYAGQLYERHVSENHLNKFGRRLLHLPAPRLVVFYNGRTRKPDEEVIRLSDSFAKGAKTDIEVCVHMVNVSQGSSPQLMQRCQPLREYAWTVERIRANMVQRGRDERLAAIDATLRDMPTDFVIRPFLLAHKAEVRDMLLTEYNEAEAMELFREEGREENLRDNLASLVRNAGFTLQQAMDALGVPERNRERYADVLQVAASQPQDSRSNLFSPDGS